MAPRDSSDKTILRVKLVARCVEQKIYSQLFCILYLPSGQDLAVQDVPRTFEKHLGFVVGRVDQDPFDGVLEFRRIVPDSNVVRDVIDTSFTQRVSAGPAIDRFLAWIGRRVSIYYENPRSLLGKSGYCRGRN